MAATIETHGEIEIICKSLHELGPNKVAKLVFRPITDSVPPWQIRVKSPSGKMILERVMRDLPTEDPQSPPALSFSVQKGVYEITITAMKGGAEGRATINVV